MSQVLSMPQQQPAENISEQQIRAWIRSELAEQNVAGRIDLLEAEVKRLAPRTVSNRATLVVFSGDMDKVLAGLVIATGAAAMGLEVSMFHTFWGLNPLRKHPTGQGKDFIEKMMGAMMPAGMDKLQPSQMSYAGLGAKLFRHRMQKNGVQSAQEFFELAREMGVKFVACGMSMEVMGIRAEELVEGIEVGGVAAYLGDAADSKVTLFI